MSGGDYHQPIAGRHPSELGDPPFAVRQPAHFLARELDQPETHRLVILVDDAGIVLLLVLLFLGLGLGVRRQEGDRVAPGRPGERRHCILTRCQNLRLAAIGGDEINLCTFLAI